MPRSRKAASNARLAESVSTVEPDFDETTSTVCVEAAGLGVAVDRGEHLAGRGRVEDDERHARRLRDDLGRERRAAHAGEHDARDALRDELGAQRHDLGDERARDADRLDPAEALGCLVLGGGTPQRRVARGDARRDEVGDEAGQRLVDDRLDVPAQVDVEAHRAISGAFCSAVGDGRPAARATRR